MKQMLALLLCLVVTPLGASGTPRDADAAAPCPLTDQPYPRPEPAYDGGLTLDFGPFTEAIQADRQTGLGDVIRGQTIPQLQSLMASEQLNATSLLLYYLDRIRRYDVGRLNAVLALNPDALNIARGLDAERAAGRVRGPLHGIPVLLKDNIATADRMHTTAGAAALRDWRPRHDAPLAQRLRSAGAVILCKANLSEWANYMDSCMPNGFSTNGGQTQNPYGPFETYGSSSGSAVAVAADLTTVSVGTETQGSIILPAGINSVVALKTSRGLINGEGIIPLLPWQDVAGPMGRSVTDVALLLGAMSGGDFSHALTPTATEGLRVAVPMWNDQAFTDLFEQLGVTNTAQQASLRGVLAERDETTRSAVKALTAAGLTVVEIPATALPAPLPVSAALEYGFKQALNEFLATRGNAVPVASLAAVIAFNRLDLANRAPYGQDHLEAAQATSLTAAEYATE